MPEIDRYRKTLQKTDDWDSFLRKNSGLPGPRGNLELAQAVVAEGNRDLFERYIRLPSEQAPENTPDLFLVFCGVVGLGRLIAEGQTKYFRTLREFAGDSRWRIREGVAMALQLVGDADMDGLLREMRAWKKGGFLEQRAAAAALCEPRLLKHPDQSKEVLDILNDMTSGILNAKDRKGEDFTAFRKGMGYCWSVAAAANPVHGKKLMERWIRSTDKDIRWIMKENLKKNRLIRCDETWTKKMSKLIG